MNSNFICSYMAMSSLVSILDFSVGFFQPVYSVLEYYEIKITSKSFPQKFEVKWSLGGPLSKLCVAPQFSINFRCQIENQVSDYRLLRASIFVAVAEIAKYKIRHNDCDSIYVIIKPSISLRTEIIKGHVPSATVNA